MCSTSADFFLLLGGRYKAQMIRLFMWPVGFLGFKRPQHTSKDWSPDMADMSNLVSRNLLSLISVMAAPPPRLFGLGVDIYCIP